MSGFDSLPQWPEGTAAVLCVAGPHAIPVSTAIRAGAKRVLLALGGRRETLSRLRADPSVALCVMTEGAAFTAVGTAREYENGLEAAPKLAVIEIVVSEITDHLADGRTAIDGGVPWRWVDEDAADTDPKIRAGLQALAASSS